MSDDDTIEIPAAQDASLIAEDYVRTFEKHFPEAAGTVQRLPDEDHELAKELSSAHIDGLNHDEAVRLYRVAREILDRKKEHGDQQAELLNQ